MTLYHYTSWEHLRSILEDGEIKLTRSNLLKPVAPHLENGNFVDATDYYKPVVWLSSVLDFKKATGMGLAGGLFDKTEVAIAIQTPPMQQFFKWDRWAEKNGIETGWFEALKQTAPLWPTFYVTESPVKIDDNTTGIIFRPDIMAQLEQAGAIDE